MSKYQLGQTWSNDFDYEGMLQAGSQVTVDTPLDVLEKLHDSFEDVNYHTEANPLWNAIIAKREGHQLILAQSIEEFRDLCNECLIED